MASKEATRMLSPDGLLAQLKAAGGVLRVRDPSRPVRAAYRRAINAVITGGLVPEGYRLRHTGRDRGGLVIRLAPAAEEPRHEKPPPIPVPAVADPDHLLVQQLTKQSALMGVTSQALPRALCIVQALADECVRRGHEVGLTSDGGARLRIAIGGYAFDLELHEEQDATERITDEEVAAARYPWQRVRPRTVSLPSGRLALRMADEWHPRTWADRTRWKLDDKLPAALAEVERRAADAEQRRIAADQAAVERHQRWTQAMAQARRRFIDDLNRDRLKRQVEEWQLAAAIRAYCADLERVMNEDRHPERKATLGEWLQWSRAEADRIDPTHRFDQLELVRPAVISAADLARYLPAGFSPYDEPRVPDSHPQED